jgi:hypothetical protein
MITHIGAVLTRERLRDCTGGRAGLHIVVRNALSHTITHFVEVRVLHSGTCKLNC